MTDTHDEVSPVMVDVADGNGEQADQEDDGRGVDDRVQGPDAGREKLHTAEVLHDRGGDTSSGLGNIGTPSHYRLYYNA